MIINESGSVYSEAGEVSHNTHEWIVLLSKRTDLPKEIKLAIDNYLAKTPTPFKEEEKK